MRCASSRSHNSHFGCSNIKPYRKADIAVFLTDGFDNKIYPTTVPSDTAWYHLQGYTALSPEIVLKLPQRYEAKAKTSLRLWYGEDLLGVSTNDNGGTACVEIYGWPN